MMLEVYYAIELVRRQFEEEICDHLGAMEFRLVELLGVERTMEAATATRTRLLMTRYIPEDCLLQINVKPLANARILLDIFTAKENREKFAEKLGITDYEPPQTLRRIK
jgi:hypothetical protein